MSIPEPSAGIVEASAAIAEQLEASLDHAMSEAQAAVNRFFDAMVARAQAGISRFADSLYSAFIAAMSRELPKGERASWQRGIWARDVARRPRAQWKRGVWQ